MPVTYLLVHKTSYQYIKKVVDYIYIQLKNHSPFNVEFILCEDIKNIHLKSNSTVYIIGDLFNSFNKTANCKYIFLNFSVLHVIGNPLSFSFSALKTIMGKRKIFNSKLKCYDYVLDYWPLQTSILQKNLIIPVKSFPVAINLDYKFEKKTTSNRKYDICFVGSMTDRRMKLIKKFEAVGLIISPYKNVIFEEIAVESKIVLNVHAHRSNHLEMPRIIGSFASKSCLVTEFNSNLEQLFPSNCYSANKYNQLFPQIYSLLRNPVQLDTIATKAYNWICDDYLVECGAKWKSLIEEIHSHFYEP
jgi:hypothetical protein